MVSGTYAYLYVSSINDNTLAGNLAAASIEVDVERIVPTTDMGLVPLRDGALGNAIKGNGGISSCIDSNGNLSCEVYKIEIYNPSLTNLRLTGDITLVASGENNIYNNLKWELLESATSRTAIYHPNGMETSVLEKNFYLGSRDLKTYYIAVWISETGLDQKQTDKGIYGGIVNFYNSSGEGVTTYFGSIKNQFIESVLAPSAISDENIDFSKPSSESGTNGIYLMNSTVNDENPIYYYRGQVDNNLIFAGFCWKIVRTTETGGLKLIYNGVPTDGTCDNTGEDTQISTKTFNFTHTSPVYVGYMYGTVYGVTEMNMSSVTDIYYYGNNVVYDNGVYTLINTIKGSEWSSINKGELNNNHYTCFSTGTTCTSVYYMNFTYTESANYITLTNGKRVEDALSEMFDYNTTSSSIKGSKTAIGTLDYWYYTNIEQAGYSSYIEDTVWCNDRGIYKKNGWDPNGGNLRSYLYFSAMGRNDNQFKPSLICSKNVDKFTVNVENGNGALDYPVGLLTADEVALAGGAFNSENTSYYLYTGNTFWTMSPYFFHNRYSYEFDVLSSGKLYFNGTGATYGVRPSISLAPTFSIDEGDGTVMNPYIVG